VTAIQSGGEITEVFWRNHLPVPRTSYWLTSIFDPNEAGNLTGDPSMAGGLEDMRTRLEAWMRATDDPLLKGPVPPPLKDIASDPDGVSPGDGMTVPPPMPLAMETD